MNYKNCLYCKKEFSRGEQSRDMFTLRKFCSQSCALKQRKEDHEQYVFKKPKTFEEHRKEWKLKKEYGFTLQELR